MSSIDEHINDEYRCDIDDPTIINNWVYQQHIIEQVDPNLAFVVTVTFRTCITLCGLLILQNK